MTDANSQDSELREDPWMSHMRRGEYRRAWAISDRVLAARRGAPCWHLPRHEQYIWDGTPFDARDVLVRCYHGLGDTIQFARYLPWLRARARRVALWVQAPLIPLVGTIDPAIELVPLHDGEPGVSCDVDLEVMELPYAFRTTLDTLPHAVPYIHVPRARLPAAGELRVGLVWRAGDWAEHRSIPFAQLAPLVALPVSWYVLQGWPGLAERPAGFGIVAGEHDVHELACVIRALDLVITVDSLAAHLAGALAVPVWTLLHASCDWRWMIDRDDSPWYPTMRLFRQRREGDWDDVVARVARALEARMTEPHVR
jgi:Glycosyltransferase family 9 (heptosyltransferase)